MSSHKHSSLFDLVTIWSQAQYRFATGNYSSLIVFKTRHSVNSATEDTLVTRCQSLHYKSLFKYRSTCTFLTFLVKDIWWLLSLIKSLLFARTSLCIYVYICLYYLLYGVYAKMKNKNQDHWWRTALSSCISIYNWLEEKRYRIHSKLK